MCIRDRSCEDPWTGPDQRVGTDPSEPAGGEPNTGGDHLGPQSIAGPRDEHHFAGGQVSTAEAGPWSAGELDAAGEPFLFGTARLQHQALRQTKGQLQPLKLGRQHGDVHLRVQQLIAGPGDLLLRWVRRQPVLMDQFRNACLLYTSDAADE